MKQRNIHSWCLIALAFCSASAFAQRQGSICLQPGGFDAFAKGAATVEAYTAHQSQPEPATPAESVRYVQVDRLPPVKVTSLAPGQITGISTAGRHLLIISKEPNMKPRQEAFYFSFGQQKSDKLCLWYKTFYASWMLLPVRGSVCSCK